MTPQDQTASTRIVASRLSGGILGDRVSKNDAKLVRGIDPAQFHRAFSEFNENMFAEPEFAGHFIDASLAAWKMSGDPALLERARCVVRSIIECQRKDGYLGTYRPGIEFETFSVWNQQFAMMGLLQFYDATGDAAALDAAVKCADFIRSGYMRVDGPDMMDALNQGIENSCILIEIVGLYERTGLERFLEFAEWIVNQWETGSVHFVRSTEHSLPSIVYSGCLKGIESLICYRGLLRLGVLTHNERYTRAVVRYWDDIRETQIGPTGNGSIAEYWTFLQPHVREIHTDLHPNENCVAVGWMQLSMDLFNLTGDVKYINAFEQTLYNHLLGSQAIDGSDFSYYQGTIGSKVHVTEPGLYSCCRYRGMTALSHLGEALAVSRSDSLELLLFSDAVVDAMVGDTRVTVSERTRYPRDGAVSIDVIPERPVRFTMRLRVPESSSLQAVRVNGEEVTPEIAAGFVELTRVWASGSRIELELELKVVRTLAVIDKSPVAMTTWGPLVLAYDSREGGPVESASLGPVTNLITDHPDDWSRIVRLVAAGSSEASSLEVTMVDYASAGSLDPQQDRFRIWIPTSL